MSSLRAGDVARPGPARGARRIALVEFSPSGGLFQFSVQLGEALARRGHQVAVLTGADPELRAREPGCVVCPVLATWHPTAGADAPEWWRRIRRGLRAARHVVAWAQVLAWVRRHRPDVVLWSTWRFPLDGWGVQVLRRLSPSTTLALIAHEPQPLVEQPGHDGQYKTGDMLRRALAGAYRDLDAAFALGRETAGVLRRTWPISAPVTVIPHGDENVFLRDQPVQSVESTRPQVLFFGTITRYKGIDDLLACWPAVRRAVPDAELLVAGNVGADVDREALSRTVGELEGARLHAGYVPLGEVAAVMSYARVVALPYRRGSQSGVAHLAFTFGRPVVATDVGDLPDVVRDHDTGRLVSTGDRDALATALIDLLQDPRQASRLGARGRESLRSGASWDDVAAALLAGLPGFAAGERTARGADDPRRKSLETAAATGGSALEVPR